MHIDELAEEIEICASCPLMCKNMCCFHLNDKTESSAPHIRNLNLLKVLNEKKEGNEDAAMAHLKWSADKLYKCTLCGQCTAWCEESRDIPNNMMAGRADLVENGFAPEEVSEIEESTDEDDNPFGEPEDERYDEFDDDLIDELSDNKGAKVGYWVGCTTSYYQPEMFEAVVKILDSAGVEFQILGDDESCCGLPQYKLGLQEQAKKLAENNKEKIEERGFDVLLVDCPECYRAFKEFYPEWDSSLDVEIVHTTQYILELIEEGKIEPKKEISKSITYHDPCELARHTTPTVRTNYDTSDIHDEPREILENIPGAELKEMKWNKLKTFCCGGELGIKEIYPKVSEKIGNRTLDEAKNTDSEVLAIACPECKRQFTDIQGNDEDFEIFSVAELVARSL